MKFVMLNEKQDLLVKWGHGSHISRFVTWSIKPALLELPGLVWSWALRSTEYLHIQKWTANSAFWIHWCPPLNQLNLSSSMSLLIHSLSWHLIRRYSRKQFSALFAPRSCSHIPSFLTYEWHQDASIWQYLSLASHQVESHGFLLHSGFYNHYFD